MNSGTGFDQVDTTAREVKYDEPGYAILLSRFGGDFVRLAPWPEYSNTVIDIPDWASHRVFQRWTDHNNRWYISVETFLDDGDVPVQHIVLTEMSSDTKIELYPVLKDEDLILLLQTELSLDIADAANVCQALGKLQLELMRAVAAEHLKV